MAQRAPREVLPAVPGIEHFLGENVLVHGVHGKVAPPGGILQGQGRVHGDVKVPVTDAAAGLPPGHGDVQVAVRQAEDAEGRADLQDLAAP